MSCDTWRLFAETVGVPCYESKTTCHMCTIEQYFILYYVSHCIDPALKINVSKLFFLFVVDVAHTFYLQSIYFLSSKY